MKYVKYIDIQNKYIVLYLGNCQKFLLYNREYLIDNKNEFIIIKKDIKYISKDKKIDMNIFTKENKLHLINKSCKNNFSR